MMTDTNTEQEKPLTYNSLVKKMSRMLLACKYNANMVAVSYVRTKWTSETNTLL